MAFVAIVGRPNVGKSTLFNRLSRRNQAIIFDTPGVTRDRNYAQVAWDDKSFTLVDTGGFISAEGSAMEDDMREQILTALEESDIILFVMDAKSGLGPEDLHLATVLRKTHKPIFCAVNKVDGPEHNRLTSEFYETGFDRIYPVSAAHGYGIDDLMTDLAEAIPASPEEEEEEAGAREIRLSVVGRPNVGKSTLVNRILGSPRVIVSPIPGTTRDPVDTAL
ncbi:MAG: ribosome biogenesis GTPase Der, partial [Syntrophobacteraceae bacterium]|nr:ribosome biogenesis GTPase Der [Syntrophobacteraceae bacterium]